MTAERKIRVALDVMGSDSGVGQMVGGGVDAARHLGDSIELVLVGIRDEIEQALALISDLPDHIRIEPAATVVPMHMVATDGVRMRDSSIAVGIKKVKEMQADAFVSPGNTGAVMATALITLGRIEGVSRPAITATFPTSTGKPTVVLDVGANADCKPQHLAQFAVMGSVYYQVVFGHESPRVGLISIGEERSKGNELVFNAQKALKDSKINFVGNIEGRDVLSGTVEVAVTDGFTGNIILKFAESIKPLLVNSIHRQIQTNIFSRMGVVLLLPFMKRMRNLFDYAESGGAPLLGVDGNVIICHGSSNPKAIYNAVLLAHKMASQKIRERIHDELVTNHFGRNNGEKDKSQDNRNGIVYSTAGND